MRTNPRMTVVATPPPLLTNDRRVASLARYSRRRAAVLARQAAQANTPRLTEVEDQDIAAPAGDDEANAKITVRSASQYLTNGASGSATGAGVAVGAHAAVSSLGTYHSITHLYHICIYIYIYIYILLSFVFLVICLISLISTL